MLILHILVKYLKLFFFCLVESKPFPDIGNPVIARVSVSCNTRQAKTKKRQMISWLTFAAVSVSIQRVSFIFNRRTPIMAVSVENNFQSSTQKITLPSLVFETRRSITLLKAVICRRVRAQCTLTIPVYFPANWQQVVMCCFLFLCFCFN